MGSVDIIVISVIAVIVVAAGWCIYKSKKNGKKCIGCPDSGSYSGSCAGCACGCGKNDK